MKFNVCRRYSTGYCDKKDECTDIHMRDTVGFRKFIRDVEELRYKVVEQYHKIIELTHKLSRYEVIPTPQPPTSEMRALNYTTRRSFGVPPHLQAYSLQHGEPKLVRLPPPPRVQRMQPQEPQPQQPQPQQPSAPPISALDAQATASAGEADATVAAAVTATAAPNDVPAAAAVTSTATATTVSAAATTGSAAATTGSSAATTVSAAATTGSAAATAVVQPKKPLTWLQQYRQRLEEDEEGFQNPQPQRLQEQLKQIRAEPDRVQKLEARLMHPQKPPPEHLQSRQPQHQKRIQILQKLVQQQQQ
eukprot:scpid96584/ scgid29822/ 